MYNEEIFLNECKSINKFIESLNTDTSYTLNESYADFFSEHNINAMIKKFSNKVEVNKFKKNLSIMEDRLVDTGIDIDNFKNDIKYASKRLLKDFKNPKNVKLYQETKGKVVERQYSWLEELLKRHVETMEEKLDLKNTNSHTLAYYKIFLFMYFYSLLLMLIYMGLFGPIAGQIITIVFVAPIVEESAKCVAVRYDKEHGVDKEDWGKVYNIIFNIFEFSSYVLSGVNPLLRLPAIFLHTWNTAKIRKGAQDADDPNSDNDEIKAVQATCIIHCAFNATGSILGLLMILADSIKNKN